MSNLINFRTRPEGKTNADLARVRSKIVPTDTSEGKIIICNQSLPKEVEDAFSKLSTVQEDSLKLPYIIELANLGWTYTAISRVCGFPKETIGAVVRVGRPSDGSVHSYGLPLPKPPRHKAKVPVTYIEPRPELLARMLELQPLATLVRYNSQRYRKEAEEYSFLMNQALEEGCTMYRLAKRLGLTHSAVSFRLVRYGYRETKLGKSKTYQPILKKNRVR